MTLDAVREALISDARAAAAATLDTAERTARERIERAQAEADRITEVAREAGEADSSAARAGELAAARRAAREIVLAAQRDALDELRGAVHEAAMALRGTPAHVELTRGLRRLAARQLGPTAEIAVDPNGDGGIVATADARSVDYRLLAIADRCLDALGPEIEQLWR